MYKSCVDDKVDYPALFVLTEVMDDIWNGRLVSYMRGISVIGLTTADGISTRVQLSTTPKKYHFNT
jgi:hypothetical protein